MNTLSPLFRFHLFSHSSATTIWRLWKTWNVSNGLIFVHNSNIHLLLFRVAWDARFSKLGSKPGRLYTNRICYSTVTRKNSKRRNLNAYESLLFVRLTYTRVLNSFEEHCIMRVVAVNALGAQPPHPWERGESVPNFSIIYHLSVGTIEYNDYFSAEG